MAALASEEDWVGLYKDGVYYQPAPYKKCGECGALYQPGGRWHNHFLCSPGCCAVRRAKLSPPVTEDPYW